jgi:putative aldouronate transport system permease protein
MTVLHAVRRGSAPRRPIWDEQPTKLGSAGKALVLGAMVVGVLLPLWTVVVTSLSSQETITQAGGLVLVPGEITFRAYEQILSGGVVTRAVGVSAFVTIVGTLISVSVTVLGAYALSKPSMIFHRTLLFLVLITMFFGAGIIPTYLLVSGLGLINSLWALILPTAVSAFNLLIMRNFFMNVDQEILDSARIDGAGEWRILLTMVLPMSKAVVAVVALFYGVGYWNAFFNAMLYLNDSALWPLQLVLRSYVLQGTAMSGNELQQFHDGGQIASLAVQMSVVVLAVIPVLVVYPFVQRHFRSGLMLGAVKG